MFVLSAVLLAVAFALPPVNDDPTCDPCTPALGAPPSCLSFGLNAHGVIVYLCRTPDHNTNVEPVPGLRATVEVRRGEMSLSLGAARNDGVVVALLSLDCP